MGTARNVAGTALSQRRSQRLQRARQRPWPGSRDRRSWRQIAPDSLFACVSPRRTANRLRLRASRLCVRTRVTADREGARRAGERWECERGTDKHGRIGYLARDATSVTDVEAIWIAYLPDSRAHLSDALAQHTVNGACCARTGSAKGHDVHESVVKIGYLDRREFGNGRNATQIAYPR